MKKNQCGFSAVAALLFLVILGIIGGTGWYVMNANKNTTDTLDNSGLGNTSKSSKQKQTTMPSSPSDETDKWYLYTSKNNEYKIRLADGLIFVGPYDDAYPSIFTRDLTTAKNGVPAKVVNPEGGNDNPAGLFINFHNNVNDAQVRGVKQPSFKTKSGLDVEKYYYFQENEPQAIDIAKGGKSYYYRITKGATAILVSYNVNPGAQDYYNLVEKMVKTVELP